MIIPWTYAQATVILDEVEGHIPVLPEGTVFKTRMAIEPEASAAQDTAQANAQAGSALRQDLSGTNETEVDSDSGPRQKTPRQVCRSGFAGVARGSLWVQTLRYSCRARAQKLSDTSL
jgi:hypothetical protein